MTRISATTPEPTILRLLLAGCVLAGSATAATPSLTAADRRALEQRTCRAAHQVGIDAVAPAPARSDAQWFVRCAAHGKVAGDPWHALFSCRKAADWNCRAAGQSVMMHINGRRVTASSETADGPTIHAMMLGVGKSVIPLAQPGRRRGQVADCQLSGDTGDRRVARVELNCDGWHLVFVRLCSQGKCQFNVASRLYLKRSAS